MATTTNGRNLTTRAGADKPGKASKKDTTTTQMGDTVTEGTEGYYTLEDRG